MLFKRNYVAKKIWQELYDELEPLNQKLKEEAGFPKHNRNVLWDELVFNSAIHVYAEGLNCFHHHLFEASTVMCRNSIDSAIFLAWHYIRTEDVTSFKLRQLTTLKRAEMRCNWKMLKKQAITLRLLGESDINFVEKVRDRGHFSAHIAIKQEESREKWEKETTPLYEAWQKGLPSKPLFIIPGHKQWTSPEEALGVLIDTKGILVRIIQNYFSSEETRSQ